MTKYTYNDYYISIENERYIGSQLFAIVYLINILQKFNNTKRKIVFNKEDNLYYNTLFKGLFNILDNEKYNNIDFTKIEICEFDMLNLYNLTNIKLINNNSSSCYKLNTFKHIDSKMRKKVIELVYSNDDYMYLAYYKYRDLLEYFGNDYGDNEVAVIHILKDIDADIDYYNNALSIMKNKYNITNIAVISDDIQWTQIILNDINRNNYYKFYYVSINKKDDYETNFLLMSMFKNIIISVKKKCYFDSLWASYISNYKNKKIIVSSSILEIHKYITDII